MKTSIYSRHRFHQDVITRAVWLYFRFNLSFRDVEELMIERGVDDARGVSGLILRA